MMEEICVKDTYPSNGRNLSMDTYPSNGRNLDIVVSENDRSKHEKLKRPIKLVIIFQRLLLEFS